MPGAVFTVPPAMKLPCSRMTSGSEFGTGWARAWQEKSTLVERADSNRLRLRSVGSILPS